MVVRDFDPAAGDENHGNYRWARLSRAFVFIAFGTRVKLVTALLGYEILRI